LKSGAPATVEVAPGDRTIAQLFLDAALVTSKSEARRLAAQKGLAMNDQPVTSVDERVTPSDGWLLRRGNHRVVRVKLR